MDSGFCPSKHLVGGHGIWALPLVMPRWPTWTLQPAPENTLSPAREELCSTLGTPPGRVFSFNTPHRTARPHSGLQAARGAQRPQLSSALLRQVESSKPQAARSPALVLNSQLELQFSDCESASDCPSTEPDCAAACSAFFRLSSERGRHPEGPFKGSFDSAMRPTSSETEEES